MAIPQRQSTDEHGSRIGTVGTVGGFQQSLAIADLMRKAQYIDESAIQVVIEPEYHAVTLHDVFNSEHSVHLHGMEADNFVTASRKLADKVGLSYRDAEKVAAFDYRQLMAGTTARNGRSPIRLVRLC